MSFTGVSDVVIIDKLENVIFYLQLHINITNYNLFQE